jgi:hypothetical protein
MSSYKNDYLFGKQKEDEVLNIIRKVFNNEIVKSEKRYERYDYKDDEYYYELKSRNNSYNAYPTTLIEKAKVFSNNLIFLFNFTDGLYYIKYDKKVFDKFECKQYLRHKRCDYVDIPKQYYFIPIEALTKVEVNNKVTIVI